MPPRTLVLAVLAASSLITPATSANAELDAIQAAPPPAPRTTGSPGVNLTHPRTKAEREAFRAHFTKLRPAWVPAPPEDVLMTQVPLGPDCFGLWEGPYPGGGRVWGEVSVVCASGRYPTLSDSKLYRARGKLVDNDRHEATTTSYAITSTGCRGGTRYYRHEEFVRAGLYSYAHQDALNITC